MISKICKTSKIKTSQKEVGSRRFVASLALASIFLLAPAAFAGLPETLSKPALEKAASRAGALHREALELHELERWSAAEELYRQAARQARALPEKHPARIEIQLDLARLLLDRGEAAAAEPLLRIATARLSTRGVSARGVSDWRLAEAQSLLGASLAAQGAEGEAKALLERGFKSLHQTLGAIDPRSRRALARLADFYRADDEASAEEEEVILVRIFAEEDGRLGRP